MLSQRRYPADGGAYTRIEWWGFYHGVWVDVVVRGVRLFDGSRIWGFSIHRHSGRKSGARREGVVSVRDMLADETSAIREAFDTLRREVRS